MELVAHLTRDFEQIGHIPTGGGGRERGAHRREDVGEIGFVVEQLSVVVALHGVIEVEASLALHGGNLRIGGNVDFAGVPNRGADAQRGGAVGLGIPHLGGLPFVGADIIGDINLFSLRGEDVVCMGNVFRLVAGSGDHEASVCHHGIHGTVKDTHSVVRTEGCAEAHVDDPGLSRCLGVGFDGFCLSEDGSIGEVGGSDDDIGAGRHAFIGGGTDLLSGGDAGDVGGVGLILAVTGGVGFGRTDGGGSGGHVAFHTGGEGGVSILKAGVNDSHHDAFAGERGFEVGAGVHFVCSHIGTGFVVLEFHAATCLSMAHLGQFGHRTDGFPLHVGDDGAFVNDAGIAAKFLDLSGELSRIIGLENHLNGVCGDGDGLAQRGVSLRGGGLEHTGQTRPNPSVLFFLHGLRAERTNQQEGERNEKVFHKGKNMRGLKTLVCPPLMRRERGLAGDCPKLKATKQIGFHHAPKKGRQNG